MEFKTAKKILWVLIPLTIFTSFSAVGLAERGFYAHKYFPILYTLIFVFMIPTLLLLSASLMAQSKQEKNITFKSLRLGITLLVGLFIYKMLTRS